jgi:hypothetical protein
VLRGLAPSSVAGALPIVSRGPEADQCAWDLCRCRNGYLKRQLDGDPAPAKRMRMEHQGHAGTTAEGFMQGRLPATFLCQVVAVQLLMQQACIAAWCSMVQQSGEHLVLVTHRCVCQR